jgi:hypothetical protein
MATWMENSIRYLLLLAVFVFVLPTPATAQTGALLRGLDPTQVFAVTLQLNDGNDYHEWVAQSSGGVCDLSRPPAVRSCDMDLAALARDLAAIPVWEYVEHLPSDINWTAWNWHNRKVDPGGYTDVLVVAFVRAWDPATDNARQWRIACSVRPTAPEQAACYRSGRLDHYNYAIVPAAPLVALANTYQ